MPRLLFAMNEPELNAYISHINNISLIRSEMAQDEIKASIQMITEARDNMQTISSVDEEGVNNINIVGVLQPKIDPCAIMFGMDVTAYSEIINSIAEGENNPDVKSHTLHFDTPGGNIVGLEATARAIRDSKKPVHGIIHGQACSAGLFLGSQCDTFVSEGELCETGSLGVKVVVTDTTARERANGVTKYTIVSDNAPLKSLDVSQKEDRDRLKAHITKMENVFINFVASGRNTTPEIVRKTYGRGATLLASEALEVGMIDKIENQLDNSINSQNTTAIETQKPEGENDMPDITMSEEQLQKLVSDTATQAVAGATASFNATLEERDAKALAEANRKAGFAPLLEKFPNQVNMINEEMAKEGAIASSEFTIKLMETETARVVALGEQNNNNDDKPNNDPKPNKPNEEKLSAEADINEMSAVLGVELPKMEVK